MTTKAIAPTGRIAWIPEFDRPRRHCSSLFAISLAAALALLGKPGQAAAPLFAADDDVPTLGRVISLAKDRAPEVLMQQANVVTARSELVGARLPILQNPYVEITAEHGAVGSARGVLSASGTAWIPFEIGGQRSHRIDAVKAGIRLENQGLNRARAIAAATAIEAFGHAVVGAARLRVLTELEAVAGTEAETYRARFQAGDATIQDARFAEVDQARYRVMSAESTADLMRALSNLELITGKHFDVPPAEPLLPPGVVVRDVAEAPAVRAAKAEAAYYERQRERWAREGAGALSVMLIGGGDEFGGTRFGGGLAYTLPAFRAFQGEQARAEAERSRALLEARLARGRIAVRLAGIGRERAEVARAISQIVTSAEPAARAAVEAANDMRRLGKGELLAVLTSRRDLALLRLRHLDLVERQWELTSTEAAITGRTP